MSQYVIGVAGLARLLETGTDLSELGSRLEARSRSDPSDARAVMDLSTLLFLTGNPDYRELAFKKQQQALEISHIFRLHPTAPAASLRLLVIMAPGDMTANTPVDCLLEDTDIDVTLLYVVPGKPLPATLPEHDLIFVAIGESDRNQVLLRQLERLSALSPKPVLNAPDKIRLLTRDRVSALLKTIPGVFMPATARVDRQALLRVAHGQLGIAELLDEGRFPIIVRPVTSHGGRNLVKLDHAADLPAYLAGLEDTDFYVSNFIDYRSADGQFKKYRIALFAGQAFACHMAISSHWMIHYFNADMGASEAKRKEEELFMNNFERDFAVTHKQSLASIYSQIGLDFVVLDCAETLDGNLLLFEVDNAAIVHALDDPKLFPYKRAPMQKVFATFREMLLGRVAAVKGSFGSRMAPERAR
jgi:glutathione synthase/RimK-type ligase-like ATP-grasp enzyme